MGFQRILSWDDLMHEIYVRQSMEKGLLDSRNGRSTSVKEVREEFGLGKGRLNGQAAR
jgi:hypothetical protein